MRVVLQRVNHAQASETDNPHKSIASIHKGLLLFAGFSPQDNQVEIEQMAQKIRSLRVFADAEGKMNLSSAQVNAAMLVISQFTVFAECKYGNRPSFSQGAPKSRAKEYFEHFVGCMERIHGTERVRSTPFGADLQVELVNDGPVTLWLDSETIL